MPAVDVGPVEDYPLGQIRPAQVNGRGLAIVRNGSGVYALRDTCPHQGAKLTLGTLTGEPVYCGRGNIEFRRFGQVLKCPWHGWDYSLADGVAIGGNRKARVRAYRARVENGRVLVETD